ncbi:helix-turn-helix domain-containing protein [Nodosilinea sp. AN01ver1]|uniref:helix-turn-helix domain-containing protein n=1 Tax=Nodosilinea sp. AN01ver1 TaxID=3423362 RepID=UPI003D31F5D5
MLLAAYQPQVIQSEAAYNEALAALETLLDQGESLSIEESAIVTLLATLIEDYEEQQIDQIKLEAVTPHEVLRHLMEARDLRQADLVPMIGSKGVVSEIINGKRTISKAQAKVLGAFFHVSPALFI